MFKMKHYQDENTFFGILSYPSDRKPHVHWIDPSIANPWRILRGWWYKKFVSGICLLILLLLQTPKETCACSDMKFSSADQTLILWGHSVVTWIVTVRQYNILQHTERGERTKTKNTRYCSKINRFELQRNTGTPSAKAKLINVLNARYKHHALRVREKLLRGNASHHNDVEI